MNLDTAEMQLSLSRGALHPLRRVVRCLHMPGSSVCARGGHGCECLGCICVGEYGREAYGLNWAARDPVASMCMWVGGWHSVGVHTMRVELGTCSRGASMVLCIKGVGI